jgi:hypothetical protein
VLAAGITDQLRAWQIDAAVVGAFALPRHAGQGFRFHPNPIALAVHEASEGAVDSAITFVFAATPRYAREQAATVRAFRAALNEARAYLETHEAAGHRQPVQTQQQRRVPRARTGAGRILTQARSPGVLIV